MTDLQTLSDRVARLEAQNRWLKTVGILAAGVVGAALLMGQAKPQNSATSERVVEAEKFILKGRDGMNRGVWAVFPNGSTGLVLLDEQQHPLATLAVAADGMTQLIFNDRRGKTLSNLEVSNAHAMLTFGDKGGKRRGAFGVLSDGTTALVFQDEDGKPRCSLRFDADGDMAMRLSGERKGGIEWTVKPNAETTMEIRDRQGVRRAFWSADAKSTKIGFVDSSDITRGVLALTGEGMGLRMFDKEGRKRSSWGVQPDGKSSLSLYDAKESARATLALDWPSNPKAESSSLRLFDKNGRIIFRLP